MNSCPSCSGAAFSGGERGCDCRIVPADDTVTVDPVPGGYVIGTNIPADQGTDVDGNPHILGVDSIVEGVINSKTGEPAPTDGDGNIVLPVFDLQDYTYACPVETQRPVWCSADGRLWTERTYKNTTSGARADALPGLTLQEGGLYRNFILTVTNDDPCGRIAECCATFIWNGWAADFPAGASGVMTYFGGLLPGLTDFGGSGIVNNVSAQRQFFPGAQHEECFLLAPGQSALLQVGMRFSQGAGVGDPLPVLFSDFSLFATEIIVKCESI